MQKKSFICVRDLPSPREESPGGGPTREESGESVPASGEDQGREPPREEVLLRYREPQPLLSSDSSQSPSPELSPAEEEEEPRIRDAGQRPSNASQRRSGGELQLLAPAEHQGVRGHRRRCFRVPRLWCWTGNRRGALPDSASD